MKGYFFKILTIFFLTVTTFVAIKDAARSVATSQLIWSQFDTFFEENILINMSDVRLFLLININQKLFEFVDYWFLQAPLILITGLMAILCYLIACYRFKS